MFLKGFLLCSLSVSCFLTVLLSPVLAKQDETFTVSVYQPKINFGVSISTREAAVKHMMKHLEEYERAAELASSSTESQFLVLPEYCLYADVKGFTRRTILNFLEPIPNPKETFPWTPCDLSNVTEDITIQHKLSCMAKNNSIYIVANVGERLDCNKTLDTSCPYDNRYQYNTNVVYAPNGTLVARYRKRHLFGEPYFNTVYERDDGVFDTPYGRFATIICFDIYYEDTLQDFIKRNKVRNIIFPNMWFSFQPLFMAAPFHSSVAWGANINLISSNLILGKTTGYQKFVNGGSGLYGAKTNFIHSNQPGLLTAKMTNIDPDSPFNFQTVPTRKTPPESSQKPFEYLVAEMKLNMIKLVAQKDQFSVCYGNFCCGLEYEFSAVTYRSLDYFFGSVDFADGSGQNDAQACTVCASAYGECQGIPIDADLTFSRFKHFRMFANQFKTPFIFPQVTVINSSLPQILQPASYYNQGEIKLQDTLPLHSATLLGRIYPPKVSGASRVTFTAAILIMSFVFFLL